MTHMILVEFETSNNTDSAQSSSVNSFVDFHLKPSILASKISRHLGVTHSRITLVCLGVWEND